MSVSSLRIATRKSRLALWQSQFVADQLCRIHPDLEVTLVPLSTRGDEILDKPLARIGGKGLFLKALEVAMLEGLADIAVHSLKDVPAELEEGFTLGPILARADAADAFVSNHYRQLEDLPEGAVVGTSSLRRRALLLALRPDLKIIDLRGNVNTRLAKLQRGDYAAIILACAGLERLDLGHHIRSRLPIPTWLPSPGQAAIAVEMRKNDASTAALVAPLNDHATELTVRAERALNLALGGSCTVPVGGWARREHGQLTLHGLVGDVHSGRLLRAQAAGPDSDPETLGQQVAGKLFAQGASEFLENSKI